MSEHVVIYIKYCTQYTRKCTFYISLIFNIITVFVIIFAPKLFKNKNKKFMSNN